MGKNNNSAPQAPDFSGLVNAAGALQQQYKDLMTNQLAFAKNAYEENKPFYQQAMRQDLAGQQTTNKFASDQLANYEQLYQPLQKQFVGAVQDYNSPTAAARARGQAMSTVAQQYGAAGDAAKRQLMSYGVDPSSARFGALDIGARLGEAAAEAAAGTQSDVNRENTALGLEGQALNIGNATAGTAIGANNSATGSGAGAVNATTSNYAPYISALANPTAFGSLANNALGLQGNFTNMGYQNQLAQYGANQNSSSGFGSALGTLAGIGLSFLAKGGRVPPPQGTEFPPPDARSSVPTQHAKLSPPRGMSRLSNIPTHMSYAGGGAIDLSGQQVPPSMSPSGGAQTDDVQATVSQSPGGPPQGRAAINVDEFIMPKDVANWIGGKQLQNMVIKARKEMGSQQQAPAQGAPAPANGPGPHYASGGAVGAPSAVPMPRAPALPTPRVGPALPSSPRLPRMTASRHPGYTIGKGAAGGAGSGPAVNLGGHQPSRPTSSGYGSPAGAVRSPVPGV